MHSFEHDTGTSRTVFGTGTLSRVGAELGRLGGRHALVLCTPGQRGLADLARVLPVPAGYSVVYFAVVIIYFTYASDVLDRTDLPELAVPVAYVLIGASGLTALATGAMAQRWGSARVAAMCLVTVAVSLALLGQAGTPWSRR